MEIQVAERVYAFLWDSFTENNCNTYFIDGTVRVILDPGHLRLFGHVRSGLKRLGYEIGDIGLVICTHAHPDHIEAVQLFKKAASLFAIHQQEWLMLAAMADAVRQGFGVDVKSFEPDIFLTEGGLSAGDTEFEVFLTPGHSPGGVSLYLPSQKVLFTGDLVFRQGVGRTDLPGGNPLQLRESILRLAALDAELLLPGHGDIVTGLDEVRRNFQAMAGVQF